eukprot:1675358-Pyramimonas_sp.AAC.1
MSQKAEGGGNTGRQTRVKNSRQTRRERRGRRRKGAIVKILSEAYEKQFGGFWGAVLGPLGVSLGLLEPLRSRTL